MDNAMRKIVLILTLSLITLPLVAYNDFIDYWTIKLNGKLIYNSTDDKKYQKGFNYSVSIDKITDKDTLEFQYYTDTPCQNCISTYFISEYSEKNGEISELLQTYLKEQKFLGPKSCKISLLDIVNCGAKGTIKAVFYHETKNAQAKELCRIKFY
jgi:hypothetical protein